MGVGEAEALRLVDGRRLVVRHGDHHQRGIRGALPATLCSICLTLMWMESALGLCAGCELYAFLRRRGWIAKDEAIEICAGGVCEAPRPAAAGVEP